jgi:hypothetical protein
VSANTTSMPAWQDEFIDIARSPRKGWDSVRDLLSRAVPVEVSLNEQKDHTLMVLRLPVSTKQLPENVRAIYSRLGVRIEDVFAELLWKRPRKGSSTLWAELVGTAFRAYRKTWLHLEEVMYLDHSHPAIDKQIRAELQKLSEQTRRPTGRRQALEAEQVSIESRFKELLHTCNVIHTIVRDCVAQRLSERDISVVLPAKTGHLR